LGAFLFLAGAVLVIPWEPIRALRSKAKLKPALSATLAIVLFLSGSVIMGQKLDSASPNADGSSTSEAVLSATGEDALLATNENISLI
jgi:hypothetical protein